MTVTSLTSLAAGIQRELNTRNTRVSESINALATGNRLTKASADVAALSVAVSLQNQVSSLRGAALNISQASSVLQVADGGVDQAFETLERMADVATQANSGTLSEADRKQLAIEFNDLRKQLGTIAEETNFNGVKLLDGSFDADTQGLAFAIGNFTGSEMNVKLPDLRDEALFGKNATLGVGTQADAANALANVRAAQISLTQSRADIGTYQYSLSFAQGAVESAIQNQDAARSVLGDADITLLSTLQAQNQVGQSAASSLLAQANRLPANILQILGS